jgi:NAD(P)H-dependent FMN reductase
VSGTVTYSGFSSAGGGARAAVALRPFLSELGCLPVSKQVIVPDANKVLDEAGEWVGEHKDGAAKTMADMLGQLAYFADALAAKKEKVAEAKAAAETEAKA